MSRPRKAFCRMVSVPTDVGTDPAQFALPQPIVPMRPGEAKQAFLLEFARLGGKAARQVSLA